MRIDGSCSGHGRGSGGLKEQGSCGAEEMEGEPTRGPNNHPTCRGDDYTVLAIGYRQSALDWTQHYGRITTAV